METKHEKLLKKSKWNSTTKTTYKHSMQTYAEIIKEKSLEIKSIVKEQHEED